MNSFQKMLVALTLSIIFFADLQAQGYADPTKVFENGRAPGLKAKLLSTVGNIKTYILIFKKGDEVVAGLTEFAKVNNIKRAIIQV